MHGIICRLDVAVMSSYKRNWRVYLEFVDSFEIDLKLLTIGFGRVKILILELWLWRNCKSKTEFYIFMRSRKNVNILEKKCFLCCFMDRFKRRGSARLATFLSLKLSSLCAAGRTLMSLLTAGAKYDDRKKQCCGSNSALILVGWIQFQIKEGK